MKNRLKDLNRRDLFKMGAVAMGIAAIPESILFSAGGNNKPEDRTDKELQRLLEIARKYGGEFGAVEPEERRN